MKLITDLVIADEKKLEEENHSQRTIYGNYHLTYVKFIKFALDRGATVFSKELSESFLKYIKKIHPEYKHGTMVQIKAAMRRLECANDDIQWTPQYHPKKPLPKSHFDYLLEQYSTYLKQKQQKTKYIRDQICSVSKFLFYLDQSSLVQIKNVSAKHILDVFSKHKYSVRFRRDVCAFLKYAYIYGIISVDFSKIIPTVARHDPVPSVYSPEEVELLLSSINRKTKTGKRNYAILLIMARLGLRASDIADLKLSDIKFNTITFIQPKNRRSHSLPLLPEIKEAIEDYINNARPVSSHENVFLDRGGYFPLGASGITSMLRYVFKKSGIDCNTRKKGSLRASLATALIDEGNSYYTVQKILDHLDVQTTKSYIKCNINQLKSCAIPVPSPSGFFKDMLSAEGVNS